MTGALDVTVITPTLGTRPRMLAEAVASVRDQGVRARAHLVVDDGTTGTVAADGSATVLRSGGRGAGAARNVALAATTTEAVALLDDDDLWLPHHLQTLTAAMARTGADVVYGDVLEQGRRDGYRTVVRDFDPDLLEQENFLCVPATLVSTAALRSVGGFCEGALEDWRTWLRLSRAGATFLHVPQVVARYRFHEDNATYGGVDPERTAAVKRLRDAATAGRISWHECAEQEQQVWR